MKRLAPFRRELFWAVLLLLVVVIAPFLPAPVADAGSDSWSVRPAGKKVLWTLARRMFGDVRRQTARLPPEEASAATLCILGPARYPDAGEWQQLHAWVAAGNTLVFAARQDDPAVTLGPFGLRIRAGEKSAPLVLDERLLLTPAAPIQWEGGAWIDGVPTDAWVAIRSETRPVAVFHSVGAGLLLAVASDELFENAWVVSRERGLVGVRLLEQARVGTGPVLLDESLTASGPPRVFGLLLSASVRPVTLQLLAVLLLFGWSASRGFGVPLGTERPLRRQITEHAQALGRLHQQTATGGTLVGAYLEYLRHELKVGRGGAGSADPAEVLSSRARLEIRAVRALLGRAARAVREAPLRGSEAAAIVRGLADIKHRATAPAAAPMVAAAGANRRG